MTEHVTGHCYKCYGTGSIRKKNMIGSISLAMCMHCRGLGRRRMVKGSGEHRLSLKIGAVGLWPGIRKGHSAYATAGVKQYGRR